MQSGRQREFDFGASRQARIGRALRAAPAVSRAVPLSDSDKMLLTCMDALALQIADEVSGLRGDEAQRHIADCVAGFIETLDEVSGEFARETSRYLTDAVSRLMAKG